MEKKKLSTADILARARAQKAGGAGEPAAEAPAAAPEPATEPQPAEPQATEPQPAAPAAAAPKAAGGGPKSTKDILAAARAQAAAKAAGGAPAAEAAAPAAKPAAAAAKPAAGGAKSTKDILAAARAQAAGKAAGDALAAVAKPAAARPAAKAAAGTAAPAGATPSVQEMLKAVREGKPAAEAAPVAKAPVAPKIPVRPAPVAKGAKPEASPRRNFLLAFLGAPFALAWTLMTASGLVALLGAARFMFPNVVVEPPSKFKVGPPGDYPDGTVSNKWKAQFAIWVVNAEYLGKEIIYALSTVCTHLGCTPNWLDGEQKFKCPCHGSGFYITGINFEGPAPRPLERFAIRVAEDGMLEVDKSQKFQQEMGQWDDPKSYVTVG